MKKYIDWIVAHKVKTGFIIFAFFIIPLLVIHFLYKWTTPYYMLQSSWSSGEIITYIAGFEAFLGTVALGVVAVRQNDKANELNEIMLVNDEKHRKYERQPSIQAIPRDISTQTIQDIFNFDGPVYFYTDISTLKGYPSKYWDKEYSFLSWNIRNITSKQVKMSFKKLEIKFFERQKQLSFFDHRINLFSPTPVIVPQGNVGFGCIIESKKLRVNKMKFGELVLQITNEANENYYYLLGFSISPNEDHGFFLYNLYERIEPAE